MISGGRRTFGARCATAVLALVVGTAVAVSAGSRPVAAASTDTVEGIDLAGDHGTVDWGRVAAAGKQFVFAKATEGTSYRDPYFATYRRGAVAAGLLVGAYHVARPDASTGAAQADFFAANGGAWSADGQTLPGTLDIEYNPYGAVCYGMSQPATVAWLQSFLDEYHAKTGRWAIIYTTADWWTTCTGNSHAFADQDPLTFAGPANPPGILPGGWATWTFWQYGDGPVPGITGTVGLDRFHGTRDALLAFATKSG